MKLSTLAVAFAGLLTLSGSASAQMMMPNGGYAAAPRGSMIQPASYSTPRMMGGMMSNAMPAATVLNGTTTAVRNVGTTVVSGTRRTVRRGLGIFRR